MSTNCPLCHRVEEGRYVASNELAVAFLDGFPVNPGHTLIVTRRHVANFFDLTEEEHASVWALLRPVRTALDTGFAPAAFNIGLNVGEAAGQTVGHMHVHVIPRYHGDVPDPRGGVRWVIPGRADYWTGGR